MIFGGKFKVKAVAAQMVVVGAVAGGGYAYYQNKVATKAKVPAQQMDQATYVPSTVAMDYCATAPSDPLCSNRNDGGPPVAMKEKAIAAKEVAVPADSGKKVANAEALIHDRAPEAAKTDPNCVIEPFVKEVTEQTDRADSDISQISAMLIANSKGKINHQICHNQMRGLIQMYQALAKEPKEKCPKVYDTENDRKIKYQNTLAAFKNRLASVPQCADILAAIPGQAHPTYYSGVKSKTYDKVKVNNCENDPNDCDYQTVNATK